jgi:hypothetical protein
MVYKESPLFLGFSLWIESTELLPASLINLLPESFGTVSLSKLSYNTPRLVATWLWKA